MLDNWADKIVITLVNKTDVSALDLKSETQVTAERLMREYSYRARFFQEEVIVDPPWLMMLDLYIHRHTSNPVSVSSLCIASRVPATTALRWIRTLMEYGYLERHPDPSDGRRVFAELSVDAIERMTAYLEAINAGVEE